MPKNIVFFNIFFIFKLPKIKFYNPHSKACGFFTIKNANYKKQEIKLKNYLL